MSLLRPPLSQSPAPAGPEHRPGPGATWRRHRGLLRSVRLYRLFRKRADRPGGASTRGLAEDTVCQIEDLLRPERQHGRRRRRRPRALHRGAPGTRRPLLPVRAGLRGDAQPRAAPSGAVIADGYWLPVRDGAADVCLCSNVLEHVSDPLGLIDEMVRATRPGGLIYLSFSNWYSPHGGHEMSPWHYLGFQFAERRYHGGMAARQRTGSASPFSRCTWVPFFG